MRKRPRISVRIVDVAGAPQTVQTLVPPSTNLRCPEPQPHLDAVRKRPRASVRIVDVTRAPVQSLRQLNALTRYSGLNAAYIRADVVHGYTVSVHARASSNRDEP